MADQLNVQQLTDCIVECFDLSTSGAVPPQLRGEFLVLGKRLRGSLLNLVSAKFIEGTAALQDANSQLAAVNSRLRAETTKMDDFVETLSAGAALVGTLDSLLKLAVAFA